MTLKPLTEYPVKIKLYSNKIFFSLLFLTPFSLFKNIFLETIGLISILLLLILCIIYIIFKNNVIYINSVWILGLLFIFISSISLFTGNSFGGLYTFLLQSILIIFISLISGSEISNKELNSFILFGRLFFIISCIPAIYLVVVKPLEEINHFNYLFNPVFYKILVPLSFFWIMKSRYTVINFLLLAIIFFLISERTSAIVILSIGLCYIYLNLIKNWLIIYKLTFWIVSISLIYGTVFYVKLQTMDLGTTLTNISREYTGSNFFSGRNEIWEIALNALSESWFFGYGLNHNILQTFNINLSTHNTYLHIALQSGLIGLSLFLIFLYSIWKKYYSKLNNRVSRLSAAYFLGFLLFLNFEVSLVGNTTVTGIFMWVIIGIGLLKVRGSVFEEE